LLPLLFLLGLLFFKGLVSHLLDPNVNLLQLAFRRIGWRNNLCHRLLHGFLLACEFLQPLVQALANAVPITAALPQRHVFAVNEVHPCLHFPGRRHEVFCLESGDIIGDQTVNAMVFGRRQRAGRQSTPRVPNGVPRSGRGSQRKRCGLGEQFLIEDPVRVEENSFEFVRAGILDNGPYLNVGQRESLRQIFPAFRLNDRLFEDLSVVVDNGTVRPDRPGIEVFYIFDTLVVGDLDVGIVPSFLPLSAP